MPLADLLRFAPPPVGIPDSPLTLYLPAGGAAKLRELGAIWDSPDVIDKAFEVNEYRSDEELLLCGLDLRLAACLLRRHGRRRRLRRRPRALHLRRLPCGPNEALPQLAAGTPLLICEATMPDDQPFGEGHLSARQAGAMATDSGASTLMPTHYSDQYDPSWVRTQAAQCFSGPIQLAEPGLKLSYEKGPLGWSKIA